MDLNEKVAFSSLQVFFHPNSDVKDEQIWVQSSLSRTHRLPRGTKESFSFTDTDLTIVSNRGEGPAIVTLTAVVAKNGLFVGSNRRAGFPLRAGHDLRLTLMPGEVLTVRDVYAREKVTGYKLQPGQSVVC